MIHICYNVNGKIFRGLLMSALSVAKHSSQPVYFHILSMDLPERDPGWVSLSDERLAIFREAVGSAAPGSKVEQIDCRGYYEEYFAGGKNQRSFYTPYAQLRLFLDLITPDGDPDKIIYLDADTMCRRDISELWDVDISAYEFGASLDAAGRYWIDENYCNSGVMLINLRRIRKTGLFAETRRQVNRRTMFMPDQSALNDLAESKLVLPRRFNEQRAIRDDTVIKHFCRWFRIYPLWARMLNYKQWQVDEVHKKLKIHDFDDIYDDIKELEKKYALE